MGGGQSGSSADSRYGVMPAGIEAWGCGAGLRKWGTSRPSWFTRLSPVSRSWSASLTRSAQGNNLRAAGTISLNR